MNNADVVKEQENKIKEKMSGIKHKIIVMSGKGGVGKTSVSVNLAGMLSASGKKTALFDADIHGPNSAKMLGIEKESVFQLDSGIEPVSVSPSLKVISMALTGNSTGGPYVWRGPMKSAVIRQFLADVNWGDLDYLVIDTPPGTGDEALSVCQLIPDITGIVVVTTPQDVSVMDAKRSLEFADMLKLRVLGMIENMSGFVCPHCGKNTDLFKKGGGRSAAKEFGIAFLGDIPFDQDIVDMADKGKLFSQKGTNSPAEKAFRDVTEKIIDFAENY